MINPPKSKEEILQSGSFRPIDTTFIPPSVDLVKHYFEEPITTREKFITPDIDGFLLIENDEVSVLNFPSLHHVFALDEPYVVGITGTPSDNLPIGMKKNEFFSDFLTFTTTDSEPKNLTKDKILTSNQEVDQAPKCCHNPEFGQTPK